MTRYTVVWHQDARDELARLWMESRDRRAVELAANAIDRELTLEASRMGTPAPDNLRQLSMPPLHVLFAVSEPDRMVRILDVAVK